jgi:hypothetical protein
LQFTDAATTLERPMPESDGTQQELPGVESDTHSIVGLLAGSVEWYGDLISPIDEVWEADE